MIISTSVPLQIPFLLPFWVRALLLVRRQLPSHCYLIWWKEKWYFPSLPSLPYKGTNPILGAPCSWPHLNLMTSQRPHLQVPSHWGLGLLHPNLAGYEHSVHSIYETYLLVVGTKKESRKPKKLGNVVRSWLMLFTATEKQFWEENERFNLLAVAFFHFCVKHPCANILQAARNNVLKFRWQDYIGDTVLDDWVGATSIDENFVLKVGT